MEGRGALTATRREAMGAETLLQLGKRLERGLQAKKSLIALAATATLAASCTAPSTSQPTASSNKSATALTATTPPAKGSVGSVTWALPYGEPPSLDYIVDDYFSEMAVLPNMCDQLFWTDPTTGKPIPDIATSMSEPNPLTLVLAIRRGIHFWDGHVLTADDVAYSLQREDDPALGPDGLAYFEYVKSITATGTYQVTIKLKKPDELLPKELAAPSGTIAEEAYTKAKGSAYGTPSGGIMCSGPFKLLSWTPGGSIVMVRNPDYWNKSFLPKVQKLTFLFTSDSATLTSALISGSIGGAYEVPPTSIPELQKTSAGKLYFGSSSEIWTINPFLGPLSNSKLRLALSLAINRSAIANSVFFGAAEPLKSVIPPTTWSYGRSTFQAAYAALPGDSPQIAKAKALVAAVGKPTKPIALGIAAGNQLQLEMGEIIQSAAATIGLDVKLVSVSPTQYGNLYTIPSARAGLDGALLAGFYEANDPLDGIPYYFLPLSLGGYSNFIDYDNPTVVQDITEARATLNPVARAELLVKAQAIFTNAASTIPLVTQDVVLFVNKGLTGVPVQWPYMWYPWAAVLGSR
jgi:peptide/nickel transport system substrate-binding protein